MIFNQLLRPMHLPAPISCFYNYELVTQYTHNNGIANAFSTAMWCVNKSHDKASFYPKIDSFVMMIANNKTQPAGGTQLC